MIEGIIGKPKVEKEVCVFSCPGNPINSDKNNTFHSAMFKQILSKLGYNPIELNEALAVVYAENPKMGEGDDVMPMSGITISIGAGQVNICMAIRGFPVIDFSIVGSGDYIDKQVSILSGQPVNIITKRKEKDLDFNNVNYDDMVIAGLDIHYSDLLCNIMKQFAKKFSDLGKIYEHPVEIVVTGGTASPPGFENKFKQVISEMDLPFKVREIRMSSDMLNTVSKGCLVKSLQEEKKRPNESNPE